MLTANKHTKLYPEALNLLASCREGRRLLFQAHDILERKEYLSSRCDRPIFSRDLERTIAEHERDAWK